MCAPPLEGSLNKLKVQGGPKQQARIRLPASDQQQESYLLVETRGTLNMGGFAFGFPLEPTKGGVPKKHTHTHSYGLVFK